jgi:hypothetical protein
MSYFSAGSLSGNALDPQGVAAATNAVSNLGFDQLFSAYEFLNNGVTTDPTTQALAKQLYGDVYTNPNAGTANASLTAPTAAQLSTFETNQLLPQIEAQLGGIENYWNTTDPDGTNPNNPLNALSATSLTFNNNGVTTNSPVFTTGPGKYTVPSEAQLDANNPALAKLLNNNILGFYGLTSGTLGSNPFANMKGAQEAEYAKLYSDILDPSSNMAAGITPVNYAPAGASSLPASTLPIQSQAQTNLDIQAQNAQKANQLVQNFLQSPQSNNYNYFTANTPADISATGGGTTGTTGQNEVLALTPAQTLQSGNIRTISAPATDTLTTSQSSSNNKLNGAGVNTEILVTPNVAASNPVNQTQIYVAGANTPVQSTQTATNITPVLTYNTLSPTETSLQGSTATGMAEELSRGTAPNVITSNTEIPIPNAGQINQTLENAAVTDYNALVNQLLNTPISSLTTLTGAPTYTSNITSSQITGASPSETLSLPTVSYSGLNAVSNALPTLAPLANVKDSLQSAANQQASLQAATQTATIDTLTSALNQATLTGSQNVSSLQAALNAAQSSLASLQGSLSAGQSLTPQQQAQETSLENQIGIYEQLLSKNTAQKNAALASQASQQQMAKLAASNRQAAISQQSQAIAGEQSSGADAQQILAQQQSQQAAKDTQAAKSYQSSQAAAGTGATSGSAGTIGAKAAIARAAGSSGSSAPIPPTKPSSNTPSSPSAPINTAPSNQPTTAQANANTTIFGLPSILGVVFGGT